MASKYGALIGGLIGSIFSLAGVLLLFETINRQKNAFQLQQFENNFFELIKIHRDNVSDLKIKDNEGNTIGREAFKKIYSDFIRILKFTLQKKKEFQTTEQQAVNISYLILFYGSDKKMKEMFKGKYVSTTKTDELINLLFEEFQVEEIINNKTPEFSGQQVRLGHYFRHLFQTVKFVDGKSFLTDEEKYDYVKILRTQLSTYEQTMFFFNALSSIGSPWELSEKSENTLITKYKLVKNIPRGLSGEINPKKYFPKIVFEDEEIKNSL